MECDSHFWRQMPDFCGGFSVVLLSFAAVSVDFSTKTMALTTVQQENSDEKGKKPVSLRKMSFYLDLKDYSNLNSLTADINGLGGTVETFLSKDVKYVVTNRSNSTLSSSFDCESSSSRPSSRSLTSLNVLQDSSSSVEQNRLKNNKTVKSRADMLLQNARKTNTSKGSCDVLQVANMWGVKVISVTMLTKWIKKLKSKNTFEKRLNEENRENDKKKNFGKCQRIKLIKPFIKYEDDGRKFMPQHRQLRDWPVLNFESDSDRTPFSKNVLGNEAMNPKEVKPLHEVVKISTNQKTPTTNNFSKSKIGKKPGYCEMCLLNYNNIYEHVSTEKHKAYVNNRSNFSNLDMRISLLPDLQEFVDSIFQFNKESSFETPVVTSQSKLLTTTEIDSDISLVSKSTKRKVGLEDSELSLPPKKKFNSILRNHSITDENKMPTCLLTGDSPSKHFSGIRKPLKTLKNESNLLLTNDSFRSSFFDSPITIEKPSPPAIRLLRSTAKRRTSSQSSSKDSSSPNNVKSNNDEASETVVTCTSTCAGAAIDSKVVAPVEKETYKENKSPVIAAKKRFMERNRSNVAKSSEFCNSQVFLSSNESSFSKKGLKIQQTLSKGVKSARRALSYSQDSSLIEKSLAEIDNVANCGKSKTIETLEKDCLLSLTPVIDAKVSQTKCDNLKLPKVSISFTLLKNVASEFARSGDSNKLPLQTREFDEKLSKTSYSNVKEQNDSSLYEVIENAVIKAESGNLIKPPLEQDFLLLQTRETDAESLKTSYPIVKQQNVTSSHEMLENTVIGGVAQSGNTIEAPLKNDSQLFQTLETNEKISKTKCPSLNEHNNSYSSVVPVDVAVSISRSGDTTEALHENSTQLFKKSETNEKISKTKCLSLNEHNNSCSSAVDEAIGVVRSGDKMNASRTNDSQLFQTSEINLKMSKTVSPSVKQQKDSCSPTVFEKVASCVAIEKDFLLCQKPATNDTKLSNTKSMMVKQRIMANDEAIGVAGSSDKSKPQHKIDSILFQASDSDKQTPKTSYPIVKQHKVSSSCTNVLDRAVSRNRRTLRRLGVQRSSTYDNNPNTVPCAVRDTSRLESRQDCLSELEGLNITVFKDPSHPRRVVVSDDTIGDLRSSPNERSPSADEVILISDDTTSGNYDIDNEGGVEDDDSAYIDYVASVEINNDTNEWDLVSDVSRASDTRSSSFTESIEDRKPPTTKLKLKRFKKNDYDSDWSYKVIDSQV